MLLKQDSVETSSYKALSDRYGYNQHSDLYASRPPVTDIYGTYPRRVGYQYEPPYVHFLISTV